MAEATAEKTKQPEVERPPVTLWACKVEFKATPFRAERAARAYLKLVPQAINYGCQGYTFTRDEQEPESFVHTSYWKNKDDFKHYWFSHELQPLKQEFLGMHDLPLMPTWHQVLEYRPSVP